MAAAIAGVSRNDLRCLNMLAEAPAKPGRIASELGLTTGSVTTLLDRLEKADLAIRRRDPNDRRGVIVHPTPYLFKTLGPVYSAVAQEIARIATTYPDEEREAAVRHLNDASSAYELAVEPHRK
ncbi:MULTISPECIES: MarR family winged helix-turn-helix transcriptional regulator [unclassified Yoonia]|uniref:MarR family winged helix-turn-helix transcriptional regulator n=1 Tax=unclassified Yoonia TaxID=2629118 RepID=UPI002AFEC358|nr:MULTISPECIES: MarR family transcriptional regulator [unclassified Yoonia]